MTSISEKIARCGFTWERSENIAEVEGTVHLMHHAASGARLMWIENADANKAFSITFKTPPSNDTGVFHILEHSVLCGSKKFPVKEPFVNLLKTSMQTFLNAMTFPDKTMYPVASTNEQDLENLMDVYLDAVFHPNIYTRPTIFEQEGWHWEVNLAPEAEQLPACDRLEYNGVVYNEMKGALSDPDSVLCDALNMALFPDTAYRWESGGTPLAIPTLTYREFLENHARHYNTHNSYIILYGDLDIERFLTFIDTNYLTPLSQGEGAKNGENGETGEGAKNGENGEGENGPNPLEMQTPVEGALVSTRLCTAPENACCARGFVVGTASDRERVIAADILLDALLGSNEAPLKRALLNTGASDDVMAFLYDAVLQPFVIVGMKGAKDNALEVLDATLQEECTKLAAGGLDHELIEAALSHAEFVMRERNFGYPDGVVLAMNVMAGWLYSDEDPTAYLRFEDTFAALRKKLAEGYFEQLITELFLENKHWGGAQVVPTTNKDDDPITKVQEEAAEKLLADGTTLEAVEARVEALREAQEAPDAPEDLALLPQLKRSDIGPAPTEEPWVEETLEEAVCVRHQVATHGITYAYRYFPLEGLTFDELPYATLLAWTLGKLDTAHHSASEIDTLVQKYLGNLGFACEVHQPLREGVALRPVFVSSTSALTENTAWTARLINEVLLETNFADTARIRDILAQRRLGLEQYFATAGHSAALARVGSYYSPAGVMRQQLGGVDFYFFVKDLLNHFEERAEALSETLANLAQRLFAPGAEVISFTGSNEDLACFVETSREQGVQLGRARGTETTNLIVPAPEAKNEAFVVPADVVYVATGYDRSLLGVPYSGSWLLATRVLSYDYLWNEVRVKGGAYGAGFQTTRPGSSRFYSYRDPRIDETIERFKGAGSWLAGVFNPTADEMDGYVVSTVASLDSPEKARDIIRRQDGMYFGGITQADRARSRSQVIEATVADIQQLAPSIDAITGAGMSCVFGSRDIIEASNTGLTVIDLLAE